MWQVTKDGAVLTTVTEENDAYTWLLKNQGQSTDYALHHGGYSIDWKSSTYRELVEGGYCVTYQHCEHPGCDVFLGVNYPADFCDEHKRRQS